MKLKLLLAFLCLILSILNVRSQAQQLQAPTVNPKFPGGVLGAEMWYICDHIEMSQDQYVNHSQGQIELKNCANSYNKALLNFNDALDTEQLCLTFRTSLENSISRDVFFVGKPKGDHKFSHMYTSLNQSVANLPFMVSDTIINHFSLGLKNSYIKGLPLSYSSDNNAQVNYYRWNNYRIYNKYKSYGQKGESDFVIGRQFTFPENDEIQESYYGRFPEFISFNRELKENEKVRVESYLAIKYGITLADHITYKSSKNLQVWNSANNDIFYNNKFGFGKDDISGLNQLQSESVHKEDYLVAAIGKIVSTNKEKQQLVNIQDEEFLIMGNNNLGGNVGGENMNKVRPLNTVWLSQNTGNKMKDYPVNFKINISANILGLLMEQEHLKLWMLHDRFVNNQEVSDFNDNYIEYYEPSNVDQFQYGYFDDVFFDIDQNNYDQYTFGVGPDMIVQVRLDGDCLSSDYNAQVIISGGRAAYKLVVFKNDVETGVYEFNDNTLPLIKMIIIIL